LKRNTTPGLFPSLLKGSPSTRFPGHAARVVWLETSDHRKLTTPWAIDKQYLADHVIKRIPCSQCLDVRPTRLHLGSVATQRLLAGWMGSYRYDFGAGEIAEVRYASLDLVLSPFLDLTLCPAVATYMRLHAIYSTGLD